MGGARNSSPRCGPRSPDDKLARVSHETIYKCLYVQTRGSLRADLHTCLSTKRGARKRRGSDNRRGVFSSGEEFTIAQRPAKPRIVPCPGIGRAI